MRKFFGRACLSAALIGSIGSSYANESNVANDNNGEVKYASSLHENRLFGTCYAQTSPAETNLGETSLLEASQNDGNVELCGYRSASSGFCLGNFIDNTVVFTGADIYKSIGDRITNINGGTGALTSSYGIVTGFNTGFALGDSGLRGQVGGSYGVYDLRGRIRLIPEDTEVEQQGFMTAGVYKRGDMQNDNDPLSYGLVVDGFAGENWGVNANDLGLGQARGIVGYALSERFEVGGFATAHLWDDLAAVTVAGAPNVRREVRASNQYNGYIRGNTPFGGSLMGYAGVFDGADIQAWQFGATGEAPLSNWFSLYGNCNYAVPSASAGPVGSGEEQFNIQFGIAYYFGGKAISPSVTGQKGLPLLDVASNSSFLITD